MTARGPLNDAMKDALARAFRVPVEDLGEIDAWEDPRTQCMVYQRGNQQVLFSFHFIAERQPPPPDPFAAAVETFAGALHDAAKRRERSDQ